MKPDLLQCSYCKMRSRINIQCLSVNLWCNGVISDHLFAAISTSSQCNGSAESLWKDLENELKLYTTRDDKIAAIANSLDDCFHMNEDYKAEMKRLTENANFALKCECPKHYFDVPRRANKSVVTGHLETGASSQKMKKTIIPKLEALTSADQKADPQALQDSKCRRAGTNLRQQTNRKITKLASRQSYQ